MNVIEYKILEDGTEEVKVEYNYFFFKTTYVYQRKNYQIFKIKNSHYYNTGLCEYINIKQLFDFMKRKE